MANQTRNREPEDIFAGPESASQGVLSRPAPEPTAASKNTGQTPKSPLLTPKKHTIIGVVLFIIVILFIAALAWYGWPFLKNALSSFTNGERESNLNQTNTSATAGNVNKTAVTPLPVVEQKDEDHDGLTDDEEKKLGTNPKLSDTDSDGLPDWDEVKIYKTDPLKKDTDSDGFTDGDEVKAGFNPNGPGELLNINQSLKNLSNQ